MVVPRKTQGRNRQPLRVTVAQAGAAYGFPFDPTGVIIRSMGGRNARPRTDSALFSFRPMMQADAEEIASWRYPDEYSFYDWTSDPDDLAELLDPAARADQYFAVEGADGSLIGFFQYKTPHVGQLEIGLGLHPVSMGRGLGGAFVDAGLEFARRHLAPQTFTLSVASFTLAQANA